MILQRVVVAVVVVAAVAGTAAAQPQRGRQQSPFAMGMRLLENLRDGMTSTFQNIFGGGSTRGKEVQTRPGPPQAPNLDAAPPIVQKPGSHPHHEEFHPAPPPQHHSPPATSHVFPEAGPDFNEGTRVSPPKGPTSSFFKVVHEQHDAAPFSDSHSFSDESFHPDSFLAGPPPFQGTVEEDHLVSVVHGRPQPLPLQHNDLPQDSFPPHKSATSFASFGNTASFKLGTLNRNERDGHAPLPRSILRDPPTSADDGHHHSLREDTGESIDHPTVILLSNSRLSTSQPATQAFPPDTPTASLSFENDRKHHVAKKASASIKVRDPKGDFNPGSKIILGTRNARDAAAGADVRGYEFGYGVVDHVSGNQFSHAEQREDGETRGSYETRLPDGRVQTVTYVANSKGFHPKITYDTPSATIEEDP